jgi:hypothetical protein
MAVDTLKNRVLAFVELASESPFPNLANLDLSVHRIKDASPQPRLTNRLLEPGDES